MRLLCLGDSLTYGYDVSHEKGWVSLAAAALRWEADNHGMCGDTTWGMLTRLRQLTLSGYDAFSSWAAPTISWKIFLSGG